jgi:hypothetical protein
LLYNWKLTIAFQQSFAYDKEMPLLSGWGLDDIDEKGNGQSITCNQKEK